MAATTRQSNVLGKAAVRYLRVTVKSAELVALPIVGSHVFKKIAKPTSRGAESADKEDVRVSIPLC